MQLQSNFHGFDGKEFLWYILYIIFKLEDPIERRKKI
jgi:hypothetical protein